MAPKRSTSGQTAPQPRKKAKAKPSVPSSAAPLAIARSHAEHAAASDNMCAGIVGQIHDAIRIIDDNPIFKDIHQMSPLTIAEGGFQEPCNYDSFSSVLQKPKTYNSNVVSYDCGGNFFWQSFVWMANHRVPVNMGMVKDMQRMRLSPSSPPSKLPFTTVIAVDNATADIMTNKGGMARISNPEPVFATILSLESAIRNKESDEVLMAWRKTLLSAPFSLEVASPGEDRFWRAQNIRQ